MLEKDLSIKGNELERICVLYILHSTAYKPVCIEDFLRGQSVKSFGTSLLALTPAQVLPFTQYMTL